MSNPQPAKPKTINPAKPVVAWFFGLIGLGFLAHGVASLPSAVAEIQTTSAVSASGLYSNVPNLSQKAAIAAAEIGGGAGLAAAALTSAGNSKGRNLTD